MFIDQVDQYESQYPELYVTDEVPATAIEDDEDMFEGETE